MKKISLLFVILASLYRITSLYAVPAAPYPIKFTQPDGSEITIRLHGDENFNYKTTLDGYNLVNDAEGVLTYARLDSNGILISTKFKAHNIEKRQKNEKKFVQGLTPYLSLKKQNSSSRAFRAPSTTTDSSPQRSYPLTGSPKSLVILVNFSDNNFASPTTTKTAFTNLLNQSNYTTNGGTGSARDYFMASSYGKFSPSFDVIGPYTLPNNMDYYGKNDSNGDDTNPKQMIIDACAAANAAGLDFTQYDTDSDGILDNVFIYYAGYNEAEGASTNTIWPHRWAISTATYFDGKRLLDYACTSELKGSIGTNMCGIGTFCHEFGHVLGLPDYYNTDATTEVATLESWDIMDGGAYNNGGRTPPTYSVYDRFYLGYLTPQQVSSASNLKLLPIYQGKTQPANTNNQAFLFSATTHNMIGNNPNPKEFFMVEYRKKTGWDTYLPAEGMLIWHIDYDQAAWNNNTANNYTGSSPTQSASSHMRVYLQPLVGSTTTPGTAFTTGSFTPTTWSGTDINRAITYITKTADSITFRLKGGGNIPSITTTGELSNFTTVQGTPSNYQTIAVSGNKLSSDLILSFTSNLHFQIKKESDLETAWAKTLSLTPTDSIIDNIKISIRYNPAEPSFSDIHTDNLTLKSNNAETVSVIVNGSSTRQIYVVPPIATEATNLTFGSLIANWEPTFDATGYYLTVYNISDGISETTEGFDKGLVAPIDWTISAGALTTSITYSGKSIPAIQFKNTGEFIKTEKYILPAKSSSFFIRSLAGVGGNILVEAWNGTKWNSVDSIPITSTLNTTKTYTFTLENNYTQFRLTYTKGNGSVAIDDISTAFFQKLEYDFREKWVTATTDTLTNLVSQRNYYYKVRASDKFLNSDNTIKYENITDFSNLIQVRTLEDKPENIFRVRPDGTIMVLLPTTNLVIHVYNTIGQQVRTIIPSSNIVDIKDLPRGQVYILQAGEYRAKIIPLKLIQ